MNATDRRTEVLETIQAEVIRSVPGTVSMTAVREASRMIYSAVEDLVVDKKVVNGNLDAVVAFTDGTVDAEVARVANVVTPAVARELGVSAAAGDPHWEHAADELTERAVDAEYSR